MHTVERINEIFESIGQDVQISVAGNVSECRAVIQPMRYKNKLYLEMNSTELGLYDAECFLYMGPATNDFAGSEIQTFIYTTDRAYNVSRADRIMLGNEVLYIWAVLTPKTRDGVYDCL